MENIMKKYKYTVIEVTHKTKLSRARIYQAHHSYNIGKQFGKNALLFCDEDIDFIKSRKGKQGKLLFDNL
jgi:hypothetical protein